MRVAISTAAILASTIGLAAPASAAAPSATAAGSWPMFRHDAALSNANPDETALTSSTVGQLKLKRTFTFPLAPHGPCGFYQDPRSVFVGDTMYAIAGNDVAAYQVSTGQRLWCRPLHSAAQDNNYVGLVVRDGRVFVAGNQVTFPDGCDDEEVPQVTDGTLWAFAASTGAPLWTLVSPDGPSITAFTVSGSRVVVQGVGVSVHDVTAGSKIWSVGKRYSSFGDLVVVGGVVPLHRTFGQDLSGFSLTDGHILWTRAGGGTPLAGDTDGPAATHLYVGTFEGVAALNPQTGVEKWASDKLLDIQSVGKKRVIGRCREGVLEGRVCALSRSDGHLLWKATVEFAADVTIAADLVYVEGGTNTVLLASTGEPEAAPSGFPTTGSRLIVANGQLIASFGRTVRVYGLG